MNSDEAFINNSHDHIMANTWRLIFERKSLPSTIPVSGSCSITDFSVLEQLLPEYRKIGLILADSSKRRCYD